MKSLAVLFPMFGETVLSHNLKPAHNKAGGGCVFRDHVLRQALWTPPIFKFNKTTGSAEPQISHGMPSFPPSAFAGGVAASL
jgi:hypothetical protein